MTRDDAKEAITEPLRDYRARIRLAGKESSESVKRGIVFAADDWLIESLAEVVQSAYQAGEYEGSKALYPQ